MPSKLILTLDGEIIKEYVLSPNSNTTIGRKYENDIQLNDLTVSGKHALVTVDDDAAYIEDLGSTNGTLVNGIHIVHTQLLHGNVIQIGHQIFTFMGDDKEIYEPTMFVRAELDETQIVLPEWEMNDDAVQLRGQPLAGLKKVNDTLGNSGIEMRKTFSTIGYQGKKLALINRGKTCYTISTIPGELGRRSTDIPLLNGETLTAGARKLKEHDILSIAGIQMEFYYIE